MLRALPSDAIYPVITTSKCLCSLSQRSLVTEVTFLKVGEIPLFYVGLAVSDAKLQILEMYIYCVLPFLLDFFVILIFSHKFQFFSPICSVHILSIICDDGVTTSIFIYNEALSSLSLKI